MACFKDRKWKICSLAVSESAWLRFASLVIFWLSIPDTSKENNRTGYRDEDGYATSPGEARARRAFHGAEYGYGGEANPKEHGGKATYREAGYARDDFTHGGDNPYGSGSEMARDRVDDSGPGHGNAEYLTPNRYRAGNAGFNNARSPLNVDVYDDDEDDEIEDGEGMFIPEDNQMRNIHHSAKSTARQPGRPMRSEEFSSPLMSSSRLPPRSSGVHKRTNVNLVPPTVPTSSISDAALLKRGLKRSKNSVMSRRSHGPNDPENILIVNLRENEKKNWPEICQILNERRIKEGKTPAFTPNGCHNRYNRNAPILFAAEGKEFIPVSVQRKLEKNPKGPMNWDDETDTLLIKAVKAVDSEKWDRVAALFKEYTGRHITAAEAALRTKVI